MEVVTRYARSGDVQIAYQLAGTGPLDVLVVPRWFSNIELDWDLPPSARFLTRLASFARLIQFDRRGAGMSGGIAGATPLEEQIDDVRAVLEASGSNQPALISIAEGCALAVLFAASHPDVVRALVLITPTPRVVRGPGYEWAQSAEERAAWVQAVLKHWGSSSPEQPWGGFAGHDEQRRRLLARHRRLSMTPDAAAASLAVVGELDVRDALSSVQCPTLVLHRANDIFIDERHSRYAAAHIPGARYVEVSARGQVADEAEQFLTGVRRPILSDRVLATVLFTDIVGSTDRAAQLRDRGWRRRPRGPHAPPARERPRVDRRSERVASHRALGPRGQRLRSRRPAGRPSRRSPNPCSTAGLGRRAPAHTPGSRRPVSLADTVGEPRHRRSASRTARRPRFQLHPPLLPRLLLAATVHLYAPITDGRSLIILRRSAPRGSDPRTLPGRGVEELFECFVDELSQWLTICGFGRVCEGRALDHVALVELKACGDDLASLGGGLAALLEDRVRSGLEPCRDGLERRHGFWLFADFGHDELVNVF
jgi:pimeloyl-ACP methyl ester carboxylesterase